jgi:hypothetical protein
MLSLFCNDRASGTRGLGRGRYRLGQPLRSSPLPFSAIRARLPLSKYDSVTRGSMLAAGHHALRRSSPGPWSHGRPCLGDGGRARDTVPLLESGRSPAGATCLADPSRQPPMTGPRAPAWNESGAEADGICGVLGHRLVAKTVETAGAVSGASAWLAASPLLAFPPVHGPAPGQVEANA